MAKGKAHATATKSKKTVNKKPAKKAAKKAYMAHPPKGVPKKPKK